MRKCAFTLLELVVVVIIVGILATIGFVNYSGIKEEALDKEAKANLQLLKAAEKSYLMDTGSWYPSDADNEANITLINRNLKLSLPAGSNRQWNYMVWGNASYGCVQANRNGGNQREWSLPQLGEEPAPGPCVTPI